ncbi:MAG: hypothetical protein IT347_02435 [Candidatus Eisenbacteria bacterium]|nr:hypothetical protein [Candidatus Eisenbacteria bacterium]
MTAAGAFRDLRRSLVRRRLAGAGARLHLTVVAITAIVSAFAYWRVRIPLDSLRRNHGAPAAELLLGVVLAALALAAALLTAERVAAMLDRRPGPEWLALPAEPALMTAHLAAEARRPALAVLPPAAAALLAGLGLLPASWLFASGVAFAFAWSLATRAAATLTRRLSRPARAPERRLTAHAAWLAAEPRRSGAPRVAPATWAAGTPARALRRLDRLASARPGPSRVRLAFVAVLALAGLAAWFDGAEPMLRRAQAFALFLPVSASLGLWAIRRACAEPADLHRPLPISLADAWGARALPLGAALAAIAAANALAAAGLPPAARLVLVPAWAAIGFALAVLGLHCSLTLVPQADAAESVYLSWLGVALVASLMMPLLGWFVLAAAVAHSSIRLPAWWRPKAAR